MTPEQFEQLVDRTYHVAVAVLEGRTGTLSDELLQHHFEEFVGALGADKKETTDKVLNQWRATLLTDSTIDDELQRRAAAAQEERVEAEKRKAAKEASAAIKRTRAKVITCDAKGITNCKEVISELNLTGSAWWSCPTCKKKHFCNQCDGVFSALHSNSHA